MDKAHNSGTAAISLLALLLCVAVGALSFYGLLKMIPSNTTLLVPWAMIAVLLLPLTFNYQVLTKLHDVRDISGINREEKRRLQNIVAEKIAILRIIILLIVLSAALMGLGLMLFGSDPIKFSWVIPVMGGAFAFSLFSISLALNYSNEVAAFKTKVLDKEKKKENQKAALERLANKTQ
jgi:phosphate/sulfate permease